MFTFWLFNLTVPEQIVTMSTWEITKPYEFFYVSVFYIIIILIFWFSVLISWIQFFIEKKRLNSVRILCNKCVIFHQKNIIIFCWIALYNKLFLGKLLKIKQSNDQPSKTQLFQKCKWCHVKINLKRPKQFKKDVYLEFYV